MCLQGKDLSGNINYDSMQHEAFSFCVFDKAVASLETFLVLSSMYDLTLAIVAYCSEQTRVLLTSAAYVHLKHAEVSKYTRNLSPASRAILLSGPAGLLARHYVFYDRLFSNEQILNVSLFFFWLI